MSLIDMGSGLSTVTRLTKAINAAIAAEREITDPATGEVITKPTWAELGEMNQEIQQQVGQFNNR